MGGGITRLRNNAFTLIELLAIIVILAIIAVITVPIILNIIENSRKGAATDSAYGYKDSVNKTYITELSKPNQGSLKLEGVYVIQSDGTLNADTNYDFGVTNYSNLPVSVSGDKPSSGKLRYSNNVLNAGCLAIGDYKVTFVSGSVDQTVKGDCSDYVFPSDMEDDSGDDNEQGNGGQNGNNSEPGQIIYTYSNEFTDGEEVEETEDWWYKYIRTNTSTGEKEVCGVDAIEYGGTGDTVCVKYNSSGYYSNFGEYILDPEDEESEIYIYNSYYDIDEITGYPAEIYEEVVSKNGSCYVSLDSGYGNPYLYCSFSSTGIYVYDNGAVRIDDEGSQQCYLNASDQSCY